MTRKNWILIAALILLVGGYVYRFTDLLVSPQIQIDVSTRPSGRGAADATVLPILFMLDREYVLQTLRVIAVSNVPAAQVGRSVWHLAAQGESEPQRGLLYGEPLKGLRVVQSPSDLVAGGLYRIELQAGRAKGSREFKALAPTAAPTE